MITEKKIQLTGYIDVPLARIGDVSAALPEHIRLTRLETGCLGFEVELDPKHQGRFLVSELFASRPDFDAHQNRTQNSEWARVTQGIARSYSISEVD